MKDIYKYYLLFSFCALLSNCSNNNIIGEGRKRADMIIDNLTKESIAGYFAPKYFNEEQGKELRFYLKSRCNFENRTGGFIDDYHWKSIDGPDRLTYVYQFYLSCDSARIHMTFNIEDSLELYEFKLESMQKPYTRVQ